ncbi:MAG: hypothetical protein HC934_05710 [Acaryochloridaceae cyanobacterium SU_2_1]|nr:hypothetical protein [Acaryochloridaceae cyanobacterium SU_2_1]
MVAYDTDQNGAVTKIEPPAVSQVFEGTVSDIEGDQITVIAPDGSSLTTTLATENINRLALAPGKEVSVTQYQGTSATRVCCIPKFVQAPPVAPPPFQPPFQAPPPPIPALW